jgi:hypothetical protein
MTTTSPPSDRTRIRRPGYAAHDAATVFAIEAAPPASLADYAEHAALDRVLSATAEKKERCDAI